uniref:Uncharacterized protein n=1 Tax=Tetranychus urticae TaxID=32264 RepID=T1KRE5_TETUR
MDPFTGTTQTTFNKVGIKFVI